MAPRGGASETLRIAYFRLADESALAVDSMIRQMHEDRRNGCLPGVY